MIPELSNQAKKAIDGIGLQPIKDKGRSVLEKASALSDKWQSKIEGIKESTMGGTGAGLCGKGIAGLMYYHDPNRIKKPLRRTNPEKGFGVDPKWKEIEWDEALEEISTRMKKIMEDNPNKIL